MGPTSSTARERIPRQMPGKATPSDILSVHRAGDCKSSLWFGGNRSVIRGRWIALDASLRSVCRPCRGSLSFDHHPGAARFALAPGYYLIAPPGQVLSEAAVLPRQQAPEARKRIAPGKPSAARGLWERDYEPRQGRQKNEFPLVTDALQTALVFLCGQRPHWDILEKMFAAMTDERPER